MTSTSILVVRSNPDARRRGCRRHSPRQGKYVWRFAEMAHEQDLTEYGAADDRSRAVCEWLPLFALAKPLSRGFIYQLSRRGPTVSGPAPEAPGEPP
jgi:hypothetical protein